MSAASALLAASLDLLSKLPRCRGHKDDGDCTELAVLEDINGKPAYCKEHGAGLRTGWGDEAMAFRRVVCDCLLVAKERPRDADGG